MSRQFKEFICISLIAFISVMMLVSPVSSIYAINQVNIDSKNTIVRILEVQPGGSASGSPSYKSSNYEISDGMISNFKAIINKNICLTQMSMPEFVSKVDQINGLYDIVYIGNKEYKGDTNYNIYGGNIYSHFGAKVNNRPNISASVSYDTEYYSGNDISDKTSANLKEFIETSQLMIFDSGIFDSSLQNTKLYKNFSGYRNKYSVFTSTSSTLFNCLRNYKSSEVKKRPYLYLSTAPVQYNGTNAVSNNGMLSFVADICSINDSNSMSLKLFIDKNGDGIYSSTEKVNDFRNISNTSGFAVNYLMPSSFSGLIPWKVELTDSFGIKSYTTGFSAYKGRELEIKVLQLLPNSSDGKNTLNLKSLENYNGQNLLYKPGEYKIHITQMKINDFSSFYPGLVGADPLKPSLNRVNPTILNGNYDMVVIGFDDAYAGDISNNAALDELTSFADSKQSILFTHDTIGFSGSQMSKVTNVFKDRLGLNAFGTDPTLPGNIQSGYKSTGMTRLALYNANGAPRFPDTVLTYKINESNITRYPFILGDIKVSPTHLQYLRLDVEDPEVVTAFTYRNEYIYNHGSRTATLKNPVASETLYHEYDGANDYYTFFKGNLTFSGTGHSNITSLEEYKMFINTMLKASVGSNHAPTVSILNLMDNQDIANTTKLLNFKVLAEDYEDRNLKCKIFLDKNGDGKYTEEAVATFDNTTSLISGIEREVVINKDVADKVQKFGLKVEVEDSQNAIGVCEIHLNNKNIPIITINNHASNYLVGDKASIEFDVVAEETTLRTEYKDLKLSANLNLSVIDSIIASGWTSNNMGSYTKQLSDIRFTPQPDLPSQKSSLSFICSAPGQQKINTSLTFLDENKSIRSVPGELAFGVRSGVINAEVKNDLGQAIAGVPVTLKGYQKNTDGSYTVTSEFNPVTVNTNTAGIASFSNVKSGYYGAELTIPEPNLHAGTVISKLSGSIINYDNPTGLITFTLNAPNIIYTANSLSFVYSGSNTSVEGSTAPSINSYLDMVLKAPGDVKTNMPDSYSTDLKVFDGVNSLDLSEVKNIISGVSFVPNEKINNGSCPDLMISYTIDQNGLINIKAENVKYINTGDELRIRIKLNKLINNKSYKVSGICKRLSDCIYSNSADCEIPISLSDNTVEFKKTVTRTGNGNLPYKARLDCKLPKYIIQDVGTNTADNTGSNYIYYYNKSKSIQKFISIDTIFGHISVNSMSDNIIVSLFTESLTSDEWYAELVLKEDPRIGLATFSKKLQLTTKVDLN